MRHIKGFTLIELMIVVAIVGILAAVAIPAYQDYTIRARVTEGLSLASSAKLAVEETYHSTSDYPTTQIASGYASPTATVNVTSVEIANSNGLITVKYAPAAKNVVLYLTPKIDTASGGLIWTCSVGAITASYKYVPQNCRS